MTVQEHQLKFIKEHVDEFIEEELERTRKQPCQMIYSYDDRWCNPATGNWCNIEEVFKVLDSDSSLITTSAMGFNIYCVIMENKKEYIDKVLSYNTKFWSSAFSELLERNKQCWYFYMLSKGMEDVEGVNENPLLLNYLNEKIAKYEEKRTKAQKKIYYWWIKIFYDPNRNYWKKAAKKAYDEMVGGYN